MSTRKTLKPRNKRSISKIHRTGGKMRRITPHPPSFTSQPWYNLVVRIDSPPAIITAVTLQAAIASQLGITFTGSYVNVRLQAVKFWGALVDGSTKALKPISIAILDPLGASSPGVRVLEQLISYPDQVNRACVGYRYPEGQRDVSFFTANATTTALYNTSGLGPDSVVYIYLMWRPGTSAPPPVGTIDDSHYDEQQDLDDSIQQLVDKINRTTLYVDKRGYIRSHQEHDSDFEELSNT